jgi:hypothetical protein
MSCDHEVQIVYNFEFLYCVILLTIMHMHMVLDYWAGIVNVLVSSTDN